MDSITQVYWSSVITLLYYTILHHTVPVPGGPWINEMEIFLFGSLLVLSLIEDKLESGVEPPAVEPTVGAELALE